MLLLRASHKIITYMQYNSRDRLDWIRFNIRDISEQQYTTREDLHIRNKLRKTASVTNPESSSFNRECRDTNNVSIICKRK